MSLREMEGKLLELVLRVIECASVRVIAVAFRLGVIGMVGGNGAGKTNEAAGSEPGGLVRGDLT
jgi:hypothetical protein